MIKLHFIIAFLSIFAFSCEKKNTEQGDKTAPTIVSTQPPADAENISINTEIIIEYDENIQLNTDYKITINGISATAKTQEKALTIEAEPESGTTYTVYISNYAVKDAAGNFADGTTFSFTTETIDKSMFEAENAILSSGLSVKTELSGYSGSGYVGNFTNNNDELTFNLEDISAGNYDLFLGYTTSNWGTKTCNVNVNGSTSTLELTDSQSKFAKIKYGKVFLSSGNNTIKISANWTYFAIDYIQILPNTDPVVDFNIDSNLITPNPSAEAVNVYNFLKENFETNIISGTMAAHSTNIDEAEWVHTETGKWPALVGFDYLDHTKSGQSWVEYDAIYNLGSDYWNNNGLITLMWHWRDPLNKTGAFYTKDTDFDISKISDVNSDEYAAMVEDIDAIAVYLKQFKDANIPILWRPLHEAAGGWFWWGAKGAQPCKDLWILMYERMVNHHKLNNLIWVWTSDTNTDALDWYPGHSYVDIVGADIYAGYNAHGSQSIKFEKLKELFDGRKILTLSECGSVPDPQNMSEGGDMWSWFMPWNGDFTRSEDHNGSTWWNTFFSYDYVITRDKMPDLKSDKR